MDERSGFIKALILSKRSTKQFYLLIATSRDGNTFKYDGIDSNFKRLESKYEKKISGVFTPSADIISTIEKSSYFEYRSKQNSINKKISKNLSELVGFNYTNTCMFSVDLIDSIYKNTRDIKVSNLDELQEGSRLFLISDMKKSGYPRNDFFYFDKDNKTLKYFIFTSYKKILQGYYLPYYYLFINDGEKSFKYIAKNPSFNELIKFIKESSNLTDDNDFGDRVKRIKYEDYLLVLEVQEEIKKIEEAETMEEFNRFVLEVEPQNVINSLDDFDADLEEFKEYIVSLGGIVDNNQIYFLAYEDFPIAVIDKTCIKIRTSRHSNDSYLYEFSRRVFKKKINEIKSRLYTLLRETKSSRIHALEVLINNVKDKVFDKDEIEIKDAFNYQIASSFSSLWSTDYDCFSTLIEELKRVYEQWRIKNNLKEINFEVEEPSDLLFKEEKVEKKVKKRYIDKSLYLLGEIASRGAKNDVFNACELFGFRIKKIHIYTYSELEGVDIDIFKNKNHIENSYIIFGQGPHSNVSRGEYSSIIEKINNEKEDFPPFAVCRFNDRNATLAPISASRVIKLLEELGLEKLN